MTEQVLRCEGAVFGIDHVPLLRDVTLEVQRGELVYLIGRTGTGKSTLLKTLYGELPLLGGKVEVAGISLSGLRRSDIPRLRRNLGIVFQDFQLLFDRTIEENLSFVLKATGWKKQGLMKRRIGEVLRQVGLEAHRGKYPYQLSGGEQQRVAIARALLNQPPLILADEPTGNLDPVTSEEVMAALTQCVKDEIGVMIVTHDYPLIRKFPGKIYEIEGGRMKARHSENFL